MNIFSLHVAKYTSVVQSTKTRRFYQTFSLQYFINSITERHKIYLVRKKFKERVSVTGMGFTVLFYKP